jgi:cobalamin biosynthesis protein CobC
MTGGSGSRFTVVEPGVGERGGGLAQAAARFGIAAGDWLDLSTGISPFAYPLPAIPTAAWTRLPDRDLVEAARATARRCYGAPESAAVVEGAGSQALLQALPRLLPSGRVAVLGFTYAEHARAWRAAGHEVVETSEVDDLAEADIAVLVNPNNPDGRILERARLTALADRLAAAGGLLVVDEAFADIDPAISLAPLAGRPGLCILRSFGKFFGLAGLRLGFALGPAPLVAALEAHLGPWRASGPALAVGRQALSDRTWIAAACATLAAAAKRLDEVLGEAGLRVAGGTILFRLVQEPRAASIFEGLGRRGILVRAFAAKPDWLRVGLPGDEASWVRLGTALKDVSRPPRRRDTE